MKNCKINLFFILLINLFIFSSCNESEGNILSYKLKGNDTLYICDISTIPNEIRNKKLSELIDSFHFISFEDNDTALFKPWKVYISDHHIGILQDAMSPFKLFDHTGKFLCDIGRIGQAEGEYTMLYSATINEQDSAIWLTPLNGNKLLRYNMKGQFISSINVRPMHKPVIRCESDNTLTATNLYFKGMPGFLYLRVFPNDSIYYSVSFLSGFTFAELKLYDNIEFMFLTKIPLTKTCPPCCEFTISPYSVVNLGLYFGSNCKTLVGNFRAKSINSGVGV